MIPSIARRLVWSIMATAVIVVFWLALRPPAVPCDIETIDRGPLVITVTENGRTRLKERYIVSSPLAGLADRITLKPGDRVVAGETVLVRIVASDPSLLDERSRAQAEARVRASEAAVLRAEPELLRREAELEHFRAEFERVEAAFESRAASTKELEDERIVLRTAEQAVQAARFALEVSKFELEQAQATLLPPATTADDRPRQAIEVRSPVTGKVLRVIRESSGAVTPGDSLIELGSLTDLEVVVDVLSEQAVRVRRDQRATLERWGGEQPLQGIVRIVEPSGFTKVSALGIEEQRVNIVIDFLDPPEHHPTLGDNFRVEARIIVITKPDVLRVPLGALLRHRGEWSVYAITDGKARLRAVRIGERSEQFAEILDGLAPGDRVIVFPSDRVRDGTRVSDRGA